jgi:hypothetical protein
MEFQANENEVGLDDLDQAAIDLSSLNLAKIQVPLINHFRKLVDIPMVQLLYTRAFWQFVVPG